MRKRRWFKYFLIVLALLLIAEIALRVFMDNESRVEYMADPFCEYRLRPGQQITRFHNAYHTNEYGMRSEPLKKNDTRRILLFGDSVLNGGTKIGQDDLLNYTLEARLEEEYKVELGVYNISAGSWGPENAYRFLENYVDFDFDLIILLFSSEDYHDNMHFRNVVGIEPAWPDDQPYLALTDLYSGYIKPKFEDWFGDPYSYLDGFDDSPVNPGWNLFAQYAEQYQKNILFYHHPGIEELRTQQLNKNGLALRADLGNKKILTVDGLIVEKPDHYIDNIHVDKQGHDAISAALFEVITTQDLLKLVN